MNKVVVEQPIMVAGVKRYGKIGAEKFHIGHAPNGGRVENNGPIFETPFAFTMPANGIVDGGFTARKEFAKWGELVTLQLGEEFEIEGYGVHKLEQPRGYGDWLVLIRIADGFRV